MAQIRITQKFSSNGATKRQLANLKTLGIRRVNHSVVRENTPDVAGIIAKVRHLVEVEEI